LASEHLNIVFIGHVDAGKSTTAGQILFLTGGVDDRTIEKYEREAKEKNRESWYMAYIMDTNEEERAKVRACWACEAGSLLELWRGGGDVAWNAVMVAALLTGVVSVQLCCCAGAV
jgi:translation initiation factor 2 gamma subunit (eIF-2gamma)